MFKILSLITAAVGNIHNINDKIVAAYNIWQMVYKLFADKAAAGQPLPNMAAVQKVVEDAESEAEAQAVASVMGKGPVAL